MKPEDIGFTFELPLYCAQRYSNFPAFYFKERNAWQGFSYNDYFRNSEEIALGLVREGIQKGENIATIFNFNCPQWNFIDMALSMVGAVHVPVYPTISDSDYLFILRQIKSRFIFVSDESVYKKLVALKKQLDFSFKVFSTKKTVGGRYWENLLISQEEARTRYVKILKERQSKASPDDVISIVYTSGTTGFPKGVMLTHNNLVTNTKAAASLQPLGQGNCILSFLPLCHVYERTANYQFQLKGATLYYCDTLKSLMQVMKEIRPDGITVVPQVLDKIIKMLLVAGKKKNLFERLIIRKVIKFGFRFHDYRNFQLLYRFRHKLADLILFQKVRNSMGGRLKYIGCGGAPINTKVKRFFWAAKMPVFEGYGLTECSPLVALNSPGKGNHFISSVGPVIPGVEVMLASDDEILCKGPNVTPGYYKLEKLSGQTIVDGWIRTGDTGRFVHGKFLQITGRKRQMFKTSFGKYIVPQVIENKFAGCPFIENIMIIGEGQYCAAAIISPNFEYFRKNFPKLQALTNRKMVKSLEIRQEIEKEIAKVNRQLGRTEQVKKHLLVADRWSPETGELSSTFKIKRNIILQKYKQKIKELYSNESL
jgi:long-chain acyl-CoA synthetase